MFNWTHMLRIWAKSRLKNIKNHVITNVTYYLSYSTKCSFQLDHSSVKNSTTIIVKACLIFICKNLKLITEIFHEVSTWHNCGKKEEIWLSSYEYVRYCLIALFAYAYYTNAHVCKIWSLYHTYFQKIFT